MPRIGTLPPVAIATWVLPLDDQGADFTHFDWPFVSRRQVLLFPASACDELTPPIHRAPPGPRAGCSPAEGAPKACLCPGTRIPPGFDAIVEVFDASAVVHTRSSSRRSPGPLYTGLFRSRFPPRLLTDMTLRRFGLSACTANPEGRTSITGRARFVRTIFYIALTPLSGRTSTRPLTPGISSRTHSTAPYSSSRGGSIPSFSPASAGDDVRS